MERLALFVILATLNNVVWSAEADCFDCNPYIQHIKAQWALNGRIPSNLIRFAVDHSPDHFRNVTTQFRPDMPEVGCVPTYWRRDNAYSTVGTFTSYVYFKNGKPRDIVTIQVSERSGQTFEVLSDGRQLVRTHINTDDPKVLCFYKCDPRTPLNPPQALCKTFRGYSKAALDKAVRELEAILGNSLSIQLPDTCY